LKSYDDPLLEEYLAALGDKLVSALERYERSAELDPTYPDPFRQLGFPPDAPRIKEYLVEIDR
jgi:hypothetical protein